MSRVREPASFAEVVDRPFAFLRAHLRELLTVHLILLLPLSIVVGATQSVAQFSMFPFGKTDPAAFPVGSLLLLYGASFLMLIGTMIAYTATYSATRTLLDGGSLRVGAAYMDAMRPRVLVTLLLSGVMVFVGLICCLAPGIILLIYSAFLVPILCEGTLWGIPAIERSFRLVHYNPTKDFVKSTSLKIFLLFLIIGAVSYAVTFLIALPGIVLGMMMAFRATAKGFEGFPGWWPVFGALQQVLSTIATSFVGIYGAAVFTMFYRDTRERMEGGSLEQALIDRLGAGAPSTDAQAATSSAEPFTPAASSPAAPSQAPPSAAAPSQAAPSAAAPSQAAPSPAAPSQAPPSNAEKAGSPPEPDDEHGSGR